MNDEQKPRYYVLAFGQTYPFETEAERDEFATVHGAITGMHAERLEDGNWVLMSRDAG